MSRAALKALDLVEAVAHASDDGLGGMEAAQLAGLDKSTASRLLRALTEAGWLMRDPRSRRYHSGRVLLSIARSAGFTRDVHAVVNAALEALRDQVGETVALHQQRGAFRHCVAGVESRAEVRIGFDATESRPLERGASGKVILAFCADEVRAAVLRGTGTDELAAQVASAETNGFLSTVSDNTWGVGAVAVPVFERGALFGSLSIAGPAGRFDDGRRAASLPALFETARQVTQALGGPSDAYARWSWEER